jgi:hypothetical protein
MEKYVKYLAIAIVVAVVTVSFMKIGSSGVSGIASASESITGNAVADVASSGNVQKVLLTFENYEYILTPSTLKKDVPVEMTVDLDSVYGCMRDVVISSFNVRKYVREGDNVITFTPDKEGTFNIVCSMNMGRGKFSVLAEGNAEVPITAYVEPEPATAPSGGCDGSCGGGCGGDCGGGGCGGDCGGGGAVGTCGGY